MMGLGLIAGLIAIIVTLIVMANAIPVLWPLAVATGGNITAMTGTDSGTTLLKAFWPVILLVVGLGLAVGLLIFALKKFDIIS